MPTREQIQHGRTIPFDPPFTRPPLTAAPPPRVLLAAPPRRSMAAVIADLMRARVVPARSREEQAFIEMQRGCQP